MKKIIKKVINKIGFDFHRIYKNSLSNFNLHTYLENNIDIVYDIGANAGQFSSELRANKYGGVIISFEPLSIAHKMLNEVSKNDDKWIVHTRTAVGNYNGQIEINIAGNSVSSSILPMLQAHTSAAEESAYISSEITPIITLDSIVNTYLKNREKLFIKIDTQGYESHVLEGAEETLKIASGLHIELSLLPLYEGQQLWLEIIKKLDYAGFEIWNINKGFTDPRNGRLLQIDGTFIKKII